MVQCVQIKLMLSSLAVGAAMIGTTAVCDENGNHGSANERHSSVHTPGSFKGKTTLSEKYGGLPASERLVIPVLILVVVQKYPPA
jgi:hypothetical protein